MSIRLVFDKECSVNIDGAIVRLSVCKSGQQTSCVLTMVEALLCSLMEREIPPGQFFDTSSIAERCARLHVGLRAFIVKKCLSKSYKFPEPAVFANAIVAERSGGRIIRRDFLPRELVWYATHRCPRTCNYCHWVDKGRSDIEGGAIEFSSFPEIASNCLISGVETFSVTGGEPMLRRDMASILSIFSSEGINTKLFTRFAFNESRARQLARANVLQIFYSLDDTSSDINEILVGNSRVSLEAQRSIRFLVDAGLDVVVVPVITRLNSRSISELAGSLRSWGVKKIRPIAYKGVSHSKVNGVFSLSAEDKERVINDLNDVESIVGVDYSTLDINEKCGVCESGISSLYMQPNGDIAYCPFKREGGAIIGRLPGDSLSEIWSSDRLKEMLHLNSLITTDFRDISLSRDASACLFARDRHDLL